MAGMVMVMFVGMLVMMLMMMLMIVVMIVVMSLFFLNFSLIVLGDGCSERLKLGARELPQIDSV